MIGIRFAYKIGFVVVNVACLCLGLFLFFVVVVVVLTER